jgi:predicted phosphodiesterase
MNKLTVIGDVHGKRKQYLDIIKDVDYSVQLGDMDFNYDHLNNVGENHLFFGGNHDNYDIINNCKNNLGDFGLLNDRFNWINEPVFFIRGEDSIDKNQRIDGVSWWRNEELSKSQMDLVVDMYCEQKPDIILTHGCPDLIYKIVLGKFQRSSPSSTSKFLSVLYSIHRPKLWLFGHHHISLNMVYENVTNFICLDELETHTINF